MTEQEKPKAEVVAKAAAPAEAEVKPPEAPKPAEAPKGVEAAKDADKAKGAEARQDLGDETAKDTAGDASIDNLIKIAKTLPENKFTIMFFTMVEQMVKHPELTGQFSTAVLAITLWLAKYAKYMDMIPGAFNESLKDEGLKDKKLSEKEAKAVLEKKNGEPQKTLTEDEKKSYADMGIEKASASYVANKLFGMTDVDSPRTLAAKIAHATKTVTENKWEVVDGETKKVAVGIELPYYKSVNLDFLGENGMPFGTVIIFTPDKETGAKVTAYATGDGDEIEFVDDKGDIKRANLNLKDKATSLIPSNWSFQAAFVPLFNSDPEYFANRSDWVDGRLTEEAKPEAETKPAEAKPAEAEPAKPAAEAKPVPAAKAETVVPGKKK